MNIVFDDGLRLEDGYREVLSSLLPAENAPLRLDASTSKTDGTLRNDEGIMFLTSLPVDVLKYHSEFFQKNRAAPQWFFVLLNRNDHGLTDLRNAARKNGLKNCIFFHAGNIKSFELAINDISTARHLIKGKALLLSKHERSWLSDLAHLLFGDNKHQYEIMSSANLAGSDSEILLLCGEKISDFIEVGLPDKMEPYFVFRFRDEIQNYLDPGELVKMLAECYHMTSERAKSRLFFVDIESELWFASSDKPIGEDAVKSGILLWDRFGLPVSRTEYTEQKIAAVARENHKSLEGIKKIFM